MKKVCTLYLQRNLPNVTNKFGDHFLKWNGDISDFYVIESGSDPDRLSKFTNNTFYASSPEAVKNGLRFCRGFNFGLIELEKIKKKYEFIILSFGDAVLFDEPTVDILLNEMYLYPKVGIISPTCPKWGDDVNGAFNGRETIAHWLTPHVFWMFRTEYITQVINQNNDPTLINHFYDGTNFRGYDTDTEIILRAYQNDWFYAVTNKTKHLENYELTTNNYEEMKTEKYSEHKKMMWDEGMEWLKRKYGFSGKQGMRNLTYTTYIQFFKKNPHLQHLMIG